MSQATQDEPKGNFIVQYFKDFKVLKETRKEYWGLQGINMLDCLAYFAMYNIAVVTLSNDWGFNDVQAGLIYTLFSSLTTIFLFISGVLTDWLGIKKALYVSMLGLLTLRVGVVVSAYMSEPVRLDSDSPIAQLDDGAGVPLSAGPDLRISARNGTSFDVDLGHATTIGDVIEAIESAPGNDGAVDAGLSPGGKSLRIEDRTGGEGTLSVSGPAGSPGAAEALGLDGETEGDTFIGQRIITALNGVTVQEINQGEGLGEAQDLVITDLSGDVLEAHDLGRYRTVRELIDGLNAMASEQGTDLLVGINNAGSGLRITDISGQSAEEGALSAAGPAAEALRIDDQASRASLSGGNLLANPLRSWLVIACMAGMAPFMAMLQTVFQAGNRRFTTKRSRGAGFNLWYLFMNVGAAGGGFLIDIIYLRLDLPHFHVFTFGIGTAVLCLVLIAAFIRNTEQLRSPEEEAEHQAEEARALAAGEKPEKKGPFAIIKAVFTEPVFWRFTLLITLLLGVRAVFLYLGLLHPKFWYRVIGPDAQVGALQAFNPILVIVGLILIIPILNKFNVYKMLVFGALITSVSMFIIAIPPSWFGFTDVASFTYGTTIAFLLVLTIGELIWSPRLQEYTAAIAPEGQEGTYLGLSMVPYFLAKIVVSGLSGAMLARWVPEPPEDNPLALQQQIASGDMAFVDSPYMMFTILGAVALVGTLAAILGKPFFTKGAKI